MLSVSQGGAASPPLTLGYVVKRLRRENAAKRGDILIQAKESLRLAEEVPVSPPHADHGRRD